MLTLALAALLTLHPSHLHAVEAAEVAQAIADACERPGPVRAPDRGVCVPLLVAMMWVESRAQLYPVDHDLSDRGPMQVKTPLGGFGNGRIGRGIYFAPHELEGAQGVATGLLVLRWKHAYTRRLSRAVELYNASSRSRRYMRAVMRVFRRVR